MKRALADYLDDCHRLTLRWHAKAPELLKAARQGDPKARKQAIHAYRELAAIIALHLGSTKMAPEDIVQEAMLILERLIDDGSEPLVPELAPAIAQALREAESNMSEPARHDPSFRSTDRNPSRPQTETT